MVQSPAGISVRSLDESELDEADRICRTAFDTFLGVQNLFGDQDYVHTRWRAAPDLAIAADLDGRLVGSNFVTIWGSFGFFGPVSVRPERWDGGIARALMETTMDLLGAAGVTHAGLFTFGHSPKHLGLYQHFGFWPRFLTPVLARPVSAQPPSVHAWTRLSALGETQQARAIEECRQLCEEVYPGLDLGREIRAVLTHGLGDVVLLDGDRLAGFALCHVGPGTEAGSGTCYVKFGAVRPGSSERDFDRLIEDCDALARSHGAERLQLGVNTAREEAYRRVLEQGFRAGMIGVAMQKPNRPAWDRKGLYVIDDWR